jgi:transglutaminase-like putative cysteine protease
VTQLAPARAGATNVRCALTLAIGSPAEVVLQVAAAHGPGRVVLDGLEATLRGPDSHVGVISSEIVDQEHNRGHIIQCEPGALTVRYEASIMRSGATAPPPVTDAQRAVALRPSRYCPTDRMAGFARRQFGGAQIGGRPSATATVQAICDFVFEHITYDATATGPGLDATETLMVGRGVCRDFAHLVATLCRANDVPARIAAVYAPGLSPMDFHAVVETAIDGAWWCWDATRLAPRETLVRIATGRDAADIAFATTLSGQVELSNVEVGAVAPGDLPHDDHERLVALA